MKKSEMKVLQSLIEQDGIKGKKLLRGVLWLNTAKPKFKVGDKVKVTDRAMRICEQRVVDWNAKVTKVYMDWREESIGYETEVSFTVNGIKKTTTVYGREEELKRSKSADSGKHFKYDGKYLESIDPLF